MGKAYFKVYHDLIDSLTPLSDTERGRLFTAMLQYSSQGAEPQLCGNERFIWPGIKAQLDRDSAKYDEVCAKNRQNVNNRWSGACDATVYDRVPKDTTVYDRIQDKDKDKDKEAGRARGGFLSDEEQGSLTAGFNAVMDAATRAGFPGTMADCDALNLILADYGADAVTKAIKRAVEQGENKRTWAYLKGILKSDPTGGMAQRKAQKPGISEREAREQARMAAILKGAGA